MGHRKSATRRSRLPARRSAHRVGVESLPLRLGPGSLEAMCRRQRPSSAAADSQFPMHLALVLKIVPRVRELYTVVLQDAFDLEAGFNAEETADFGLGQAILPVPFQVQ